jgi:hypothetical protein
MLHWAPFAVAFAGLFFGKIGLPSLVILVGNIGASGFFLIMSTGLLIFGLLARIAQPHDPVARMIIGAGAGCMLIPFFGNLDAFFNFHASALEIVHNLLWFLMMLVAISCLVYVVPPTKLPPALQSFDALAPVVAAVLIVWLPVQQVLFALAGLVHDHMGVTAILFLARGLLMLIAYFVVLMMFSPAAYEEAKKMFQSGGAGGPPGGYPPNGYPPTGYPPPGYPPQAPPGYGPPPGAGGPGGGWPQQ